MNDDVNCSDVLTAINVYIYEKNVRHSCVFLHTYTLININNQHLTIHCLEKFSQITETAAQI